MCGIPPASSATPIAAGPVTPAAATAAHDHGSAPAPATPVTTLRSLPAPALPTTAVGLIPVGLLTSSALGTSPYVALTGQANVDDGSVRNAALAERSLSQLRAATANLTTPAAAAAAGYHPNPSAPDHWINDSIYGTRNGYDLARPATLMFENGALIGVMLSHDPRTGAPPDLGAGSWHTHPGTAGEEYALHIRLDKPVATAYGTEHGNV